MEAEIQQQQQISSSSSSDDSNRMTDVSQENLDIVPRASESQSYTSALETAKAHIMIPVVSTSIELTEPDSRQQSIVINESSMVAKSSDNYTASKPILSKSVPGRNTIMPKRSKTGSTIRSTLSHSVDTLSNEDVKTIKKKASGIKAKTSRPAVLPSTVDEAISDKRDSSKTATRQSSSNSFASMLKFRLDGSRKIKSMSDISMAANGDVSMESTVVAPIHSPPTSPPVIVKHITKEPLSEEERLQAIVTIQRYYRFYRMRMHFSKIVVNVNNKNHLKPDARARRKSVLLWMMGGDISKSSELLGKVLAGDASREPSHESLESPNEAEDNEEELRKKEEAKAKERKRVLVRYVNEFNMEPNKGMNNLIKHGCVANDPHNIAHFLLHESRCSKTKIGEYLGAGCFVDLLDFTGLDFDNALRHLLRTFRLPGEAQKIDRVMNEFARRYCHLNPTVFSSADTAYVLAYSLIMLNTDAHNPNVKKKMSLQDFLRNNRGIDNKHDLPEAFMKRLYLNIVNNEIKMNEHDNMYKINEICSQVSGKFDNIVAPHRRLIRDFFVQQVTDYSKPNTHRHERILFLFNDLMFIVKPVASSYNGGTFSSTISDGAVSSASAAKDVVKPGRYQYRYTFNMITLFALSKPDNSFHTNVIDLFNANGRLITLSFINSEEKQQFQSLIEELIQEVSDMEEDKLTKLRKMTEKKSYSAKTLIEITYNISDEQFRNRYKKYSSLRQARIISASQAQILMGKKKKVNGKNDLHPDIQEIEHYLNDFYSSVKLTAPSPSPEVINVPENGAQEKDEDTESKTEASSSPQQLIAPFINEEATDSFPTLPVQPRKNAAPPAAANRKRRNTVTGYLLEQMFEQLQSKGQ